MVRELIRRVGRLQRLAVFEAAARLGSFTAAARELGMTQPAVTRQLRALEESVNTALFRRTSNRSELTDAGRTLLLEVSRSFSGIEGALAGLGQRAELFVLACYPGFAQQWLVPRLDRVQEALGGRELRLWLFDREADLAGGAFDAAIQVGHGAFPAVDCELLFPESVFPVAAPALARARSLEASSSPERLLDVPLLHMDDGDRPFDPQDSNGAGQFFFYDYPWLRWAESQGYDLTYTTDVDTFMANAGALRRPRLNQRVRTRLAPSDRRPTDGVNAPSMVGGAWSAVENR